MELTQKWLCTSHYWETLDYEKVRQLFLQEERRTGWGRRVRSGAAVIVYLPTASVSMYVSMYVPTYLL